MSLKDDIESKIMRNPYVIIIGIVETKGCETLEMATIDIQKMKQLWWNVFGYRNLSIINDESGTTAKQINKKLNQIRAKIEDDETIDGLIIIYTGHGTVGGHENYIIAGDGNRISLNTIQEKFSAYNLDQLANKPKIIYLDCCRGRDEMKQNEISELGKKKSNNAVYITKLSDFMVHYATCQNYVSYGQKNGSHLINAIYKSYTKYFQDFEMGQGTINLISMIINKIVNTDGRGYQTSEIQSRLPYEVYVIPYNQKNNNHKDNHNDTGDDAKEAKEKANEDYSEFGWSQDFQNMSISS